MIKDVVQKGSDILRQRCNPVTNFLSIQGVIDDLIETIAHLKTTYGFSRGIGLAAPQIGELVRISVAEYKGQQYVLINPEIVERSEDKQPIREGCISFFQYRAKVPRNTKVKVRAFDRQGEEYFIEGEGDFAMLLQHELDHLDGVLYIDHLPNGENDMYLSNEV
ncbi:MAG: peptide deformylase [Candidatus Aenigmarchaeota archaeon]|nr:peptide deformylase [Candidatus Aenigmarchaeota archaeon]